MTPTSNPTSTPKAVAKQQTTSAPSATPYQVNGVTLVNKKHPVASSYVPPWAKTQPHGLSPELNAALAQMFARAKQDGFTLSVRSGYRSFAEQDASYKQAFRQYDATTASRYFAPAGASEHQTGLAADLTNAAGQRGYAFAATKEAAWIAAHATEFGLIVRYPQNKQHITGYNWESWHVRYVGKEVAAHFAANPGLTLEEYLGEA